MSVELARILVASKQRVSSPLSCHAACKMFGQPGGDHASDGLRPNQP